MFLVSDNHPQTGETSSDHHFASCCWAAVYGFAQSQTQPKWLSSSSSRHRRSVLILSYNLCDGSESLNYFFLRENPRRTFLVIQWIEIHLPMQGTQSDPWWGKILYAAEQLSPCATATEPVLYSLCSTTREAIAMRNPRISTKNSPSWSQLEKALMQQWGPSTVRNK